MSLWPLPASSVDSRLRLQDFACVASSGGFLATDRWGVLEPGGIFRRALELTGARRPRVLFVMTASGDDRQYLASSYQAVSGLSVEVVHVDVRQDRCPERQLQVREVALVCLDHQTVTAGPLCTGAGIGYIPTDHEAGATAGGRGRVLPPPPGSRPPGR